jgi:hypothetical protein
MREVLDPTPLLRMDPGSHWLPQGIRALRAARREDSLVLTVSSDSEELAGWFPVRTRAETEPELREWLVYATRALGAGPASAMAWTERVIELLSAELSWR